MWQLLRRLRSAQPDVAVILPEPLAGQVRELLADDRTVQAIALTRRRTGLNLLTAVRAVNALNGPSEA